MSALYFAKNVAVATHLMPNIVGHIENQTASKKGNH